MIRSRTIVGLALLSLQVSSFGLSQPAKVKMSFVKVKPGQFAMGCSKNDVECAPDEKPAHKVKLTKAFEIGRYEVSQEEWQTVMEIRQASSLPTLPIEGISWGDAQAFMKKLNDLNDG